MAADYRLWVPDPASLYEANVTGTVNLLQAAADADVNRIVYTSSVATLGLTADATPADERTPASLDDMIGHYKRSKFQAEVRVRELAARGVPATIVNPSAPIGPRDIKPTPTGRLIVDAATGRMPTYVDTGLNVVHVDDVAEGHLAAYRYGEIGERYILGGENMSLRSILGEVASTVGRPPPRIRLPHGVVLPIAYAAEAWARLTGGEPIATVDGVRMSKKLMFFTSEHAERRLDYRHRPARRRLRDAVGWFSENGYLN